MEPFGSGPWILQLKTPACIDPESLRLKRSQRSVVSALSLQCGPGSSSDVLQPALAPNTKGFLEAKLQRVHLQDMAMFAQRLSPRVVFTHGVSARICFLGSGSYSLPWRWRGLQQWQLHPKTQLSVWPWFVRKISVLRLSSIRSSQGSKCP